MVTLLVSVVCTLRGAIVVILFAIREGESVQNAVTAEHKFSMNLKRQKKVTHPHPPSTNEQCLHFDKPSCTQDACKRYPEMARHKLYWPLNYNG